MIYNLSSSDPRAHQDRSLTEESSLMLKTGVVNKENSIKISHHRRTQHQREGRHDVFTVLHTIMENETEECSATPRMTTSAEEEKREPIRKRSHRRTCATDWNELSRTYHGDSSKTKQQQRHRRSLALTKDEFTEITMLCDELHGPWAPRRVRHPVVWAGWKHV